MIIHFGHMTNLWLTLMVFIFLLMKSMLTKEKYTQKSVPTSLTMPGKFINNVGKDITVAYLHMDKLDLENRTRCWGMGKTKE